MSAPAWMPLYVGDYLADTTDLSTLEHGAYMLLIMHYWQKGRLPDDDAKLARICRLTPDEWSEVRASMAPLFDAGWKHKRIDAELAKAHEMIDKRSAAGKAGASARYGKRNATAKANVEQTNARAGVVLLDIETSSTEKEEASTREDTPESEFEVFWNAYPNRVSRVRAEASFENVREAFCLAEIMAGVDRYVKTKPPDVRWMNPATFLDEQRWMDEPANPGKPTPSKTPMIWIPVDDPRWPVLAEQWKQRKGRDPPRTSGDGGMGWNFPSDWMKEQAA